MTKEHMREIQNNTLELLHRYVERVCIEGGTDAEIFSLPRIVETLRDQCAYVRIDEEHKQEE